MNRFSRFAISIALIAAFPALQARAQMKVSYENTPRPAKQAPALHMEDVDQLPEYNGDLGGFLSQELQYPDSAREAGVQGVTTLEFIVAADGILQNVHISQSSGHALLDNEALRLFREMQTSPKWKPGSRNGRPVPVIYTLPVTFKL